MQCPWAIRETEAAYPFYRCQLQEGHAGPHHLNPKTKTCGEWFLPASEQGSQKGESAKIA